jgi:hypothetical protein
LIREAPAVVTRELPIVPSAMLFLFPVVQILPQLTMAGSHVKLLQSTDWLNMIRATYFHSNVLSCVE